MVTINLPLTTFPELATANLRLRELRPHDAPAVYRLYADDEVTRYYDLDSFYDMEQATDLITRQARRFEEGKAIRWAITQKNVDVVIGTIGCVITRHSTQGGLGYDLASPYWRRGIMTEALGIVIRYCFKGLGLNRLQALVMPPNVASAELLLKLGFVEEGILREYAFFKGRFQDLRCFSLLRREFEADSS